MPLIAAYIALIVIWSTTPLAIQWSTAEVGFLFGVGSRMLIGTVICAILLKITKQRLAWTGDAIIVYLCAATGIYGAMLFVYWGALYVPSGIIAVLFGLAPLLTWLIAKPILNETGLNLFKLFGLLVALGGLAMISQTETSSYKYFGTGVLLLLTSVSLHSLSAVLTKRYNRHYSALTVTTGGLMISSVLFVVTWLIFDGSIPKSLPTHTIWSILYLGVIATGGGFILYFYVLNKVRASSLALIPLVTPVSAIAIGILFNGERLTLTIVTGTLLIMTGLVFNVIKLPPKSVTRPVAQVSVEADEA